MFKPFNFSNPAVTANVSSGGVTKFNGTTVSATAVQSDGKILVGGPFTNYAGTVGRNCLVRLNSDGTLDTAFCINAVDGAKFNSTVNTIAVQSDGKILVGGAFSSYGGTANRTLFIRLNSDGTPDTAFCANAVDGKILIGGSTVSTIMVQSDGKILVGGGFTNYAATTNRSYLIRLNSDGTLDTAFCVNAVDGKFNSGVNTTLTQSDGKILVGGGFTNYAATTNRSYFIRLNSDGTLDTAFCANATDGGKFALSISTTAIQSDNKILVGGNFTSYAGTVARSRLIRLNSDGTLDTAFCVNAADGTKFNATIVKTLCQSDGKILVGGSFTNYAGTAGRSYFIRLNSDGTLDTAFCANATDGTKFSAAISTIATQSDGNIFVGGFFGNYAGTVNRNYFIRLQSDGTPDTAFCELAVDSTKLNNLVDLVLVQPDGKILVGGSFTNYKLAGRSFLIRTTPSGVLDIPFCANASDGSKFNSQITTAAAQSDGKILVGGNFTGYGGGSRSRLVRLNSDGTVDAPFCVNASDGTKFSSTILAIAVQSDGKILVGGTFTNYAGTLNRSFLIRLNSDGTLDTAFCANATDGAKFGAGTILYDCIRIQSDGKILVGGNFADYAGTVGRSRLVRLNSDGTLDTAFCANAVDSSKFSSDVRAIRIQSDGKILVGGAFTNYAGTANRSRLIRLNSDGTLDTAFCANATDGGKFGSTVTSMSERQDGKLVVVGSFTNYGGTTGRNYLAFLNSDGTYNTLYESNAQIKIAASFSLYGSLCVNNDSYIAQGTALTYYGPFIKYDRNFNVI